MTKLDCNVVNCSYNADNCCRRTDIQVEGTQAKTSSETCCGSFAPKGCGCQSCHTTDVKKDTTVSCEACGCKFNEDHACHAPVNAPDFSKWTFSAPTWMLVPLVFATAVTRSV